MTGVDGVDFAGTPGIDVIETVGLGTDTTGTPGIEATETVDTDTTGVNGAEGVVTVLLGTGVLVVTRKEVGGEDGAVCGTDDLTIGVADCATRFDDWETGSSVSPSVCLNGIKNMHLHFALMRILYNRTLLTWILTVPQI